MTPSYAAPFPPSIQPLTFPAFTLPASPTMTLFSYKIPQRGMAHKALLWLGCGFALSGLWTSEKQCGEPLESCCPPCRYLTLHGVGKRCHSHNRAPQVAQGNQQRPNTVWQLLKHERGIEDNFFSGAVAGIVCVSVCTWLQMCVHASVHAGTLPAGKERENSYVFRLPCEHPVHGEKNGDRHSAMLISILSLRASSHIHTRLKQKLPVISAKSLSIRLLSPPSNWHTDWWWKVWGTAKWLIAGLRRVKDNNSKLLSKI